MFNTLNCLVILFSLSFIIVIPITDRYYRCKEKERDIVAYSMSKAYFELMSQQRHCLILGIWIRAAPLNHELFAFLGDDASST